jgi:hypothetical protein
MKSFLSKLFSSSNDVSSKRFIGIIASFVMFTIAIVDLFTSNTVEEFVFDGLMWIVIAGLGFVASEKLPMFERNRNSKSEEN